MTMQPRRRSSRKCLAPKKDLRQVPLAGKPRKGSNAKLDRWCKVTEDGQEPEQATMIAAMNAWQQRTGRMNIPVPEREPRHVSSARKLRQAPTARYHHTPTMLSASKSCQTSTENCRHTPIAYTDGNTKSNLLPSYRGFNAELHVVPRNVVQDTFNNEDP